MHIILSLSISPATPIVDYHSNFQRVYFRPGTRSGRKECMTVSITQDNEEECAELFLVKYFDYTFPTNNWPTTALVRITG